MYIKDTNGFYLTTNNITKVLESEKIIYLSGSETKKWSFQTSHKDFERPIKLCNRRNICVPRACLSWLGIIIDQC